MSANTKIEWADHTFNPWTGCTKVSPGCDHCYAESWAKRSGTVQWGDAPRRRTTDANWRQPIKWDRAAREAGRRDRVFCASLADVFDNQVPIEWLRDLCSLIETTPNLVWLLLTKRIGNVFERLSDARSHDWLAGRDNVWLGATVVNQAEADRDIPKLLATPARVRFLSIEPMLGPIDLNYVRARISASRSPITKAVCYSSGEPWIDWVIAGGESGPHARPSHPDWFRSLRDQCAAAGVPFFFNQWGEWGDGDSIEATGLARHGWWEQDADDGGVPRKESLRPEVFRVGKKAAGRLLDGIEDNGLPS